MPILSEPVLLRRLPCHPERRERAALKDRVVVFRPQVVVVLHYQPAFCAPAHHALPTQIPIWCQAALAADQALEGGSRNLKIELAHILRNLLRGFSQQLQITKNSV